MLGTPPKSRSPSNPWPLWPKVFRVEYGHEEVSNFLIEVNCFDPEENDKTIHEGLN